MQITPLPIAGAYHITPAVFGDERGYFKEVYATGRYNDALGAPTTFVQDNVSRSSRGVLRGLHAAPEMAKLVQALEGSIFDVIVDIRKGSETFGHWHAVTLDAQTHGQVFVPAGCLHGFLTLSPAALVLYKQTRLYDPAVEIGVAWDDPELAIAWPLDGPPSLSAKDASNRTLREVANV